MKNKLLLAILTIQIVFSIACEKKKDVQIQDEKTRNGLFSIAELQEKQFNMQTGDTLPVNETANKATNNANENLNSVSNPPPYAKLEKPLTKISHGNYPDRLTPIISAIPVIADSKSNVQVHFVIDKSYMRVYKVVSDSESLTLIEKALAKKVNDKYEVPFFKIKIEQSGILKKEKDANGDETSNLVLDTNVDFKDSSHILLSMKSEDILILGEELDDKNILKEIFLSDRIDKKISTLSDFQSNFNLSLKGFNDGPIYTTLDPSKGSEAILHVFRIIKKSDITDPKQLAELNDNKNKFNINSHVQTCPTEVVSQLTDSELKLSCVLILAYDLNVELVSPVAETVKQNGYPTEIVQFKPSQNPSLIKIPNLSVPIAQNGSELNLFNTIPLQQIKNKEFLLRRTFQDGAASIMYFGPGASGELDLVQLQTLENRIVVKKVISVNGVNNPSSLDTEELMSIPVKYLKKDPNGPSQVPKYIETKLADAEVLSLDWSANTIPMTNSPLSYINDGQCFNSTNHLSVTDMKNEIVTSGLLSFSIEGSYSFKPDCMSFYGLHDYWYGGNLQSTFNIKERVSFFSYDKSKEKNSSFDLPFPAQNQLRFGVFTTDQIKPDEFGNIGRTHTEVSRPVIYDFSDGKKLTYTLAGLPNGQDDTSTKMRKALIEGTEEVIQDWNKSLAKAFSGTPLYRNIETTPYIELEVANSSHDNSSNTIQNSAQLGDLDKNYIWNFEKNLDSGLLGMSQAGPHPRTGQIVQNNVLMYSGNLLSYVGSLKEKAKLLRLDKELRMSAEKSLKQQKTENNSKNNVSVNTEKGVFSDYSITSLNSNDSSKIPTAAKNILSQLKTLKGINLKNVLSNNLLLKSKPIGKMNLSKNQISFISNNLKNQFLSGLKTEVSNDTTISEMANTNDKAMLAEIYKSAKLNNSFNDPDQLESIVTAKFLKSKSRYMTQEQKDYFSDKSRRLAVKSEFFKKFRKGANCALTAQDLESNLDLENAPTELVFKEFYKATLAHEIGHSLGLTHNFEGSLDKANFRFNDEPEFDSDPKGRNYASIMDYIPDDVIHYQGPGPYDVRALRVSYTGLIELDPAFANANNLNKGVNKTFTVKNKNISVNSNNEISLADFKTAVLGENSWWKLDSSYQQILPVKNYAYCTDIHVGGTPTCNRWDLGTNAYEISQNFSKDYKNLYPVMNQRGSRVSIRDVDTYISRLFYNLFNLRSFMDETFYLAIQGYPTEYWVPQALGAINSLYTYTEILHTPIQSKDYLDPSRFQLIDYQVSKTDEQGNPVLDDQGQPILENKSALVESKSLEDLMVAGDTFNSVSTRGIQYDKVIALLMLTERGTGNPRYENMGLRISYAEFEKYVLGAEQPEQSLLLSSIQSVLKDHTQSMILTGDGFINLPSSFENRQNELTRFYNILASTVLLDADTIEEKYNFASLFRVGSSLKSAPSDRLIVSKLDQSISSPVSLKLWAFDNSVLSNKLIRSAAQNRVYIENTNELAPLLKGYVQDLLKGSKNSQYKNFLVGKLKGLNKKEVLLSAEDVKQGFSNEVLSDIAAGYMVEQILVAAELKQYVDSGQLPADYLPLLLPFLLPDLEETKKQIADLTKSIAILGLADKTLATQFTEVGPKEVISLSQVLALMVDDQNLESNHNMIVSNTGMINKFVNMLYPELNK